MVALKDLTIEEKLRLLTGKNEWQTYDANGKLPSLFLSDGPSGLRMQDEKGVVRKATAMPTECVVANTWSVEAARLHGETIASDAAEAGADILAAPGINMKRTPLCGRNFEYYSEDPYLAGQMAKAFIEGVQSNGIGCSVKHFAANNREYDRLFQSSDVDERTLHEIYFPAFEYAIQAKPWTVMGAYNPVNGIYASENKWLLKDVLRGEFGYDGVIVSDWGAVHDTAARVKASCDLEMPYNKNSYDALKAAYEDGRLTEAEIDESVTHLLQLIEKSQNAKKTVRYTKAERHENAVKIAEEGIVLLKNDANILPLKKERVLVTGHYATKPPLGGGGSSFVQTDYEQQALHDLLKASGCETDYEMAICILDNQRSSFYVRGAYEKARRADKVIICVGTDKETEAEGFDRTSLRLHPSQERFITEMSKYNDNLIVVVYAGSAIDMSPWIDKAKAVVFAGYAGEGVNEALASILTGRVNPSGKLSESFPLCLEDTYCGSECGNGFCERYTDGVFVGYRYYDSEGKDVLFPFGHGLSYARTAYSDIKVEKKSKYEYEVSYSVENLSDIPMQEVSQLYVRDVFSSVARPVKELKNFAKTPLGAHKKKTVRLALDKRAFAFYSVENAAWTVENGEFEILVGASSRDIRLQTSIIIEE